MGGGGGGGEREREQYLCGYNHPVNVSKQVCAFIDVM